MSISATADRCSDRIGLWLMMVLTFVTGIVDAVGYLGLDRVFVGNMTGNIVIIGMALAGADGLPVLGPVVALATFAFGAFTAGLSLRSRRGDWGWSVSILLATGGTCLALLALAHLVPAWVDTSTLRLISSSAMAAAMGVQAAVARSLAIPDMTTVVVTSTLTSLASETFVNGTRGAIWNRRFFAITAILLGALIGALLLRLGLTVPLLIATALTYTVVAVGHAKLHTRQTPEVRK